jgi:hypothetical protein
VIADAIKIPGVDVTGPEALDEVTAPQVEIYDPDDIPRDDPAPIKLDQCKQYQHQHRWIHQQKQSFAGQRESELDPVRVTLQA